MMKTLAANHLAIFVLVTTGALLIRYLIFDIQYQLGLSAVLLVVVLVCWFFRQPQERGGEPTRWWIWMFVFSIVWPFIAALIYNVSYLDLLIFHVEAFNKIGYLGLPAMGPFIFALAAVSIIRGSVLKLVKRASSNNFLHGALHSRRP